MSPKSSRTGCLSGIPISWPSGGAHNITHFAGTPTVFLCRIPPLMRFRWAQCLCPKNHSVFGFALDNNMVPDSRVETLLRAAVKAMLLGRGDEIGSEVSRLDPWCALCGAPPATWLYHVTLTEDYPSWE